MHDRPVRPARVKSGKQLRPHVAVQSPHHLVKLEGHPPHWAALRTVGSAEEHGTDLPFRGPEEMPPEGIIDQDNGIGGIETPFDILPGAETVDDPAVLCDQGLVPVTELRSRHHHPTGQPLNVIDGMVGQSQSPVYLPAKGRLATASVSDHSHSGHAEP